MTDREENLFLSAIHGHHVYKSIWYPVTGEQLYRLKGTWVMALHRDLTLVHCNICYEYIYVRLLFEGGYYFR